MSKRARVEVSEVPDLIQSGTTTKTIIPLPAAVATAIKRSREEEPEITVKRTKTVISPGNNSLVPVKGNPKIQRCTRCNTFVKKGAGHTDSQCNARIVAKKHRKPSTKSSRRFRMTSKRKNIIRQAGIYAAGFLAIAKSLKSLQKHIRKYPNTVSVGVEKKLNKIFQTISKSPNSKRTSSMLRKMGVI